ncbi:hypothetical protein QN354_18450 [Cryobacterium sp. 5I3]|uniref:hypothetical protein n=1 Tax=Cryobacterium sp. 5I3 TaxID=3048592 RepID=UPI002B222C80|nr:hypothetical protein [Cryobacterium sp. 5I3]MEB0203711.1 hypothetical protein [Cryobacterium sp. 5I3]
MTDELEDKLALHGEQLVMLGAEIDRQRVSFNGRQAASNSRAALLVGSATIASGVQLASGNSVGQVLAVVASLVAAALGVASLWPRGGHDVSVGSYIDTLYRLGPRRTELDILNAKTAVHEKDESELLKRQNLLRFGFTFLVLAIAFTALQVAGIIISIPTNGTP